MLVLGLLCHLNLCLGDQLCDDPGTLLRRGGETCYHISHFLRPPLAKALEPFFIQHITLPTKNYRVMLPYQVFRKNWDYGYNLLRFRTCFMETLEKFT